MAQRMAGLFIFSAGAVVFSSPPPPCGALGTSLQLIPPPLTNSSSGKSYAAWLVGLRALRSSCRRALGLNDSLFELPELAWTQDAYVVTQMHTYDRYFYDRASGNYTVSRWLTDVKARYGGVDAALVWNTYPQLGFDDRNAFDLIRLLPGGIAGIRSFVTELRAAGVATLWPYNPWDDSTREEGQPDATALAQLLVSTRAQGFNGDTMGEIPQSFYLASVAADSPAAMQAELGAFLRELKQDGGAAPRAPSRAEMG